MELSLHGSNNKVNGGLIMDILKKLISKCTNKHHWHSVITNGDLIRTCSITGQMEYRDVSQQKWIPIKSEFDINEYREKRGED